VSMTGEELLLLFGIGVYIVVARKLGPGVKHIGTMNTSNATKSASFKTAPQASVARCCSVSASADEMSFQRSSTSSIPTLILTNPGTIPASFLTSSGTNM